MQSSTSQIQGTMYTPEKGNRRQYETSVLRFPKISNTSPRGYSVYSDPLGHYERYLRQGFPPLMSDSPRDKQGTNQNSRLKQKGEELLIEIEELQAANRKYETNIKEKDRKLVALKREFEEVEGKTKEQHTRLEQQKVELRNLADENSTVKRDLSRTKLQLTKVIQENDQLSRELSDSKARLSRLIGNRLTDNNPDIADLSDENRPTKLAEKYQELYDEQWTDAFEEMEKNYHNEKKSIRNLKLVLEEIKEHCEKMAKIQNDTLLEAVTIKKTGIHVSSEILKHLKDLRKATAGLSLSGVYERYLEEVKKKHKDTDVRIFLNAKVLPFIKRCIELCWLMSVQDPPLVFGNDPKSTEHFDTDVYKFYTKTGMYCEYVVWPPLNLFKDGPLLSKGIAQGFTPYENLKPTTSQRGQAHSGTSLETGTETHVNNGYTRHSDDVNKRDAGSVNTKDTKHMAKQTHYRGHNLIDSQMPNRYYSGPNNATLSKIGRKPEVEY